MYYLLLILIYIAFISLGLPDSVLGAAWPSMYRTFGVPEGSAGIITMLMYSGTMISSIASDWIIRKLGTGKVLVISVAVTAITMLGFSMAGSFTVLCLIALPYGLGGGCVDASLNNYVATHYKARHMNFLHCFWGIGTIISPLIMGAFIEKGGVWTQGYRAIAFFQFALVAVLMFSIPLWKKTADKSTETSSPLSFRKLMRIPGVKASLVAFFCYCALETTMGLWTSTYLSEVKGVDLILATKCGMLFYIGIATGRLVSGMISEWLGDKQLIYTGTAITMLSLFALTLLPSNGPMLYLLIVLAGIGCGPIYPGMVHHSPEISGPEGSQMLIGFQLALSSAGSIMVPALFGIIVNNLSVALMPGFCMIFAFIMLIMVLNSVRS